MYVVKVFSGKKLSGKVVGEYELLVRIYVVWRVRELGWKIRWVAWDVFLWVKGGGKNTFVEKEKEKTLDPFKFMTSVPWGSNYGRLVIFATLALQHINLSLLTHQPDFRFFLFCPCSCLSTTTIPCNCLCTTCRKVNSTAGWSSQDSRCVQTQAQGLLCCRFME